MRYGIPYKGSKSKYAQQILGHIPSAENFYDLFSGGGAITHCALLEGRWENYIMNDISKGLTQLFLDAVNGKYKNENRFISRDEFYELKDNDAFIRYIWSFSNNGRDYMYGKNIEQIKRLGHNAVIYGDIKPLEEIINADLSFLLKIDDLSQRRKSLYRYIKNIRRERFDLERLERLECLERLQYKHNNSYNLINLNQDYRNVEIKPNSVIYCDIPYKKTNGYARKGDKSDFDYDAFYDWAEKQTEPVFISEYSMPDDRFKCIMEINTRTTMCATNNNKRTVERLYIPRCQEDISIKQLTLF